MSKKRINITTHEKMQKSFHLKTFASVSSDWLQAKKPQLKPSSVAKYLNIMQLYLIPKFGEQDISTISRSDIQTFSRNLLISGSTKVNGLSPKTVNSILSVIKSIFAYASREMDIPVADIGDLSVKQSQKPMRILSLNEQAKMSQYLYDNLSPCHLGILLCVYTGLRIGEICALKWEDIFLTEQYLVVNKTMQRIQIPGDSERKTKIVIQAPKSDCSIRKIPIPSGMHQLLIDYKKNP